MKILLATLCTLLIFFVFFGTTSAQEKKTYKQMFILYEGDTVPIYSLPELYVFQPYKFKTRAERQEYTKLVRDVRIAYPYAQMVAASIIETYEYMESLPNDKARQKHLAEVEKYMMAAYKPKMKKLTRSQGKILIKLIDRECNTSSYHIVRALKGNFTAGMYNVFAGLFGNSLKTKYDPDDKDRHIENIVIQLKDGSLDYYYSTGVFL